MPPQDWQGPATQAPATQQPPLLQEAPAQQLCPGPPHGSPAASASAPSAGRSGGLTSTDPRSLNVPPRSTVPPSGRSTERLLLSWQATNGIAARDRNSHGRARVTE